MLTTTKRGSPRKLFVPPPKDFTVRSIFSRYLCFISQVAGNSLKKFTFKTSGCAPAVWTRDETLRKRVYPGRFASLAVKLQSTQPCAATKGISPRATVSLVMTKSCGARVQNWWLAFLAGTPGGKGGISGELAELVEKTGICLKYCDAPFTDRGGWLIPGSHHFYCLL